MNISEFNPADFKTEAYPPTPASGMIVGLPKGLKVTHIPTGLYAVSEGASSQHRNRETAWLILLAKLAEKERTDAKSALDRQQPVTGWLLASPQDEGESAEHKEKPLSTPADVWARLEKALQPNPEDLRKALENEGVKPYAVTNCTACTHADSWGIPVRPCCNSCVLGSNWEPLNSDSVNPNKVAEVKVAAEATKAEAKIRTLLEVLETDAHFIFNHNPAQTPQEVRDVIEWYSSSIQVILTALKV